MGDGEHLNAAARAALDLQPPARIAHIRRPRWIGYTRAQQLLAKLDDLLTHPKTHRMPNLLIVGDTNAGKTMLANRFVQVHPASDNPVGDAVIVPVLVVQAPPGPDENRFYNTILEGLGAPYTPRERVAQKQVQVLRLLKHIGLRMLIIDEVHNVLSGPVTKQRQFLHVLKYLGNDLQIPLVGVGIKEALRALQADPQLANRFEPAALPRWRLDQEFQRLLVSFERALPLRTASRLADEPLARKLLALSEGSLGELSALLTAAAVYAVTSGAERIDAEVLVAIEWVPPSERRRQAEHLV
jgi:Bacterial TniB protein